MKGGAGAGAIGAGTCGASMTRTGGGGGGRGVTGATGGGGGGGGGVVTGGVTGGAPSKIPKMLCRNRGKPSSREGLPVRVTSSGDAVCPWAATPAAPPGRTAPVTAMSDEISWAGGAVGGCCWNVLDCGKDDDDDDGDDVLATGSVDDAFFQDV